MRVLDREARKAFPRLADFCFVHVANPRTLRCVCAAHRTRQYAGDMRSFVATHPIRRDDLTSTVAFVARSGKPALRPSIYDDDRPSRSAVARLQQKLAPKSALVVPVMGEGVVLGTLSLCYSQSGRSHGPQHVAPAQRLAARVAAALSAFSRVAASNAASRLRTAARHARQRSALRR